MSGFDDNNSLVNSGKKGLTISDSNSLSFSGKLGANQGTLTHVDHFGNLNQTVTPPPTPVWTVVDTNSTLDFKALHPTATAFQFVVVGGGGGGHSGAGTQSIGTQAVLNRSGGTGGGRVSGTIPASMITGAFNFVIGNGGNGGQASIMTSGANLAAGSAGTAGTNSTISIGASVLVTALGGKSGPDPTGSGGSFASGITATVNTSTNATTRVIANANEFTTQAIAGGSGGNNAARETNQSVRYTAARGQANQAGNFGERGVSTSTSSVGNAIAGLNGANGDITASAVNSLGSGGGGGGTAAQVGFKGGNGGNGGFPGGAGGAGGHGTYGSALNGQKVAGDGGNGAKGAIIWRPVF
jgi:hypothetical protein